MDVLPQLGNEPRKTRDKLVDHARGIIPWSHSLLNVEQLVANLAPLALGLSVRLNVGEDESARAVRSTIGIGLDYDAPASRRGDVGDVCDRSPRVVLRQAATAETEPGFIAKPAGKLVREDLRGLLGVILLQRTRLERAFTMAQELVDALQRIAVALETIADVAEAMPRKKRRRPKPVDDLPLSETDRAAARRAARSLGLVVRDPSGR